MLKRLPFVVLLTLPTTVFALDEKYQECYDITVSSAIQSCMNDRYAESMENLTAEQEAFILRAANSVTNPTLFNRKAKEEQNLWKRYTQSKCQMEASSDALRNSYSYWISYYQCLSIKADKKARYYRTYRFD